jgi:hypothetical protein
MDIDMEINMDMDMEINMDMDITYSIIGLAN